MNLTDKTVLITGGRIRHRLCRGSGVSESAGECGRRGY